MIYLLYLYLTLWLLVSLSAFYSQGRKAWRYVMFFPAFSLVVLLRYPAAVIAVLLFSSPDKLTLSRWKWLETIDNTLIGDLGWRTEHMIGHDPLAWYNRIGWLWRNGGNRFNYEVLGIPASTPPAWAWWAPTAIPLFAGRFLDLRLGWNLDGPQLGRCKYVFSVRIKTKP